MEDVMELLAKAEHCLRTADHIIYITYPLLKEKMLIKKILDEVYSGIVFIVSAITKYESAYKRAEEKKELKEQFQQFLRCAPRFNVAPSELRGLSELIGLAERFHSSSIDFVRREKLVFMNNGFRTETVGLDDLKKYLTIAKTVLLKIKKKIEEERTALFK